MLSWKMNGKEKNEYFCPFQIGLVYCEATQLDSHALMF